MKKAILLSIMSIFVVSCGAASPMVEEWDTVSVHYKWTFQDGEVFDSSYERWQPIEFTTWAGEMIPWFDSAVVGMSEWETKSITLEPSQAYGERSEENYDVIQREELSDFEENWIKIQTGALLPTMYGEFEIVWIKWEEITVDMNHPMAWKTLNFDVELVEIVK